MGSALVAGSLRGEIAEIQAFDQMHELASEYEARHGRAPINLSHWDPTDSFIERLRGKLPLRLSDEPIRYRFSTYSEARPKVLEKLGQQATRRILLTENGTNAVLAAANTLSLRGVRRVKLLCPSYFAARYALSAFGIDIVVVHWVRENGRFLLPEIVLGPNEALWLENPVFNTGMPALGDAAPILEKILSNGDVVVVDGSLEPPGEVLVPELGKHSGYISIHAPHKSICVNGLKFGAVTFDPEHYNLFSHWADILGGGLSLSSELAVAHFLSPAFAAYSTAAIQEWTASSAWLEGLVASHDGLFEIDPSPAGYWRTLYAPWLPVSEGEDRGTLARLINTSGATFIPGSRAAFDPAWGFCFRVNLLRLGARERAALRRLLTSLSEEKSRLAT